MNWEVLGASVRRARKEAKRTQGELARTLGMSRATISGIENGTIGEIGARKLDGLCQALGLELFVGPKHSRPTLKQLREERRVARNS